jgi:hypothetical protein
MRARCPSCSKLYEVASEDLRNEAPLFECVSCACRFSMEYPPADPMNVLTFIVPLDHITQEIQRSEPQEPASVTQFAAVGVAGVNTAAAPKEPGVDEMKACPKCAAMNGRRAKECYACHVIFERLEGLPQDPSLRAQPSLVRKWKNLLENFSETSLHEDFIRSCHELDALKFAVMKYEEIKAAQGGDSLCDQMLARIQSLMMVGLAQKPLASQNKKPAFDMAKYRKYFFWGPYTISTLMILLGMMNLGHRNLIGVGVALACMTSGLIVMIRGRISWSDFVD